MDREEAVLEFCRKMPKVELHAHLNGSISPATMKKLLERYSERLSQEAEKGGEVSAVPELWQTSNAEGDRRTIEERFAVFKTIHTIVDDEEAVSMVAHDVVKEFAADGVVYLELRSTPRANPARGMTKRSYIEAVLRGIDSGLSECKTQIHVRLLLSIDRRQSTAEALDTVELAQEYSSQQSSRVVGIDLGGDPSAGDMKELLPVLKSAKEKGLKLALHMAEIPDRSEEILLLLSARPDRIGHGTFLHREARNKQAVNPISQQKIPIEVCLTSNVKARTVSSYSDHQLGFWRNRHHLVIVCTDDKGVFSTSLSEEYCTAARAFSLTRDELWRLSREAVNATFEKEPFREQLRKLWDVDCS